MGVHVRGQSPQNIFENLYSYQKHKLNLLGEPWSQSLFDGVYPSIHHTGETGADEFVGALLDRRPETPLPTTSSTKIKPLIGQPNKLCTPQATGFMTGIPWSRNNSRTNSSLAESERGAEVGTNFSVPDGKIEYRFA